jgi:hypothetical protein
LGQSAGARLACRTGQGAYGTWRPNTAVVALAPAPRLVAGDLSRDDQKLVFAWIKLNQSALLDFWDDGDAFRLLPRLKTL